LTGIARLHRLRNDPKLAGVSAVWPFETGWAARAKWLPAHILVLHAEIYPSVIDPLPDGIKDRGQVRAMWHWARDLDCDNLLWREFCRPIEVALKEEKGDHWTGSGVPNIKEARPTL
jgi:hypothetical protein